MSRHWIGVWFGAACMAAFDAGACGQTPPPAILELDVNYLTYENDVADYNKLATDAGAVTGVPGKNFIYFLQIGDIVAVNGKPAKGTWVSRGTMVALSPNPAPGQAIADISRANVQQSAWEILTADGKPVGTIFANGMGGGTPPPSSPSIMTQGNQAIIGGTGAFFGVHGQQGGSAAAQIGAPVESVSEDPANRRNRRQGFNHQIIYLVPAEYPQVLTGANGPAVVHSSDYTPVTASNPAAGGELLTMIASGLGPTNPSVDRGQLFPSDRLYVVNSPVDVLMNGANAEVLYAGGYPGTTDRYQVNFRVPSQILPGMAFLQLSAAWITGPAVQIPVK